MVDFSFITWGAGSATLAAILLLLQYVEVSKKPNTFFVGQGRIHTGFTGQKLRNIDYKAASGN